VSYFLLKMGEEALIYVFILALTVILFVCISVILQFVLNGQIQRVLVQLRLVQLWLPGAARLEPEEEPEPVVIGQPLE
jgi:hypothetical protein